MAAAVGGPLTFVTRAEWAPLVRRHPGVTEVLALPSRGTSLRGVLGEVAADINRRIKPAAVFDWHGVPLSRRLSAAVKAPAKVVYAKYALERWLLATVGIDTLPPEGIRVPALYAATAAPWGCDGPDASFRLTLDGGTRARLKGELGVDDGMAALAPGARHAAKAWPAGHWRELARRVRADGRRVLLLGSASERDLCAEIAAGDDQAVNAAGRCEVGDLPELLAGAAFLVTNDSAFAHLAPLVGVPCVDLFGPTSPRFGFAPWGPRDKVLYKDAPCSPCSKHGARPCWRARRVCLEDIAPGDVFAAAVAAGAPA